MQPSIKTLEISMQLTEKRPPEILFWTLFLLNNKKNFLNFYHKKKYYEGKSFMTKSFLNISKKLGSKKLIISNINKLFQKVLLNAKEINLIKIFPNRSQSVLKVFKFYEISYEEAFNGLIDLTPRDWSNYNLKFLISPKFYNGFHFRFYLQNLQLPVI